MHLGRVAASLYNRLTSGTQVSARGAAAHPKVARPTPRVRPQSRARGTGAAAAVRPEASCSAAGSRGALQRQRHARAPDVHRRVTRCPCRRLGCAAVVVAQPPGRKRAHAAARTQPAEGVTAHRMRQSRHPTRATLHLASRASRLQQLDRGARRGGLAQTFSEAARPAPHPRRFARGTRPAHNTHLHTPRASVDSRNRRLQRARESASELNPPLCHSPPGAPRPRASDAQLVAAAP
jgi:hypothetical protein